METDVKKEYITCSAILFHTTKELAHMPINVNKGFVLCGHRHHNIQSLCQVKGLEDLIQYPSTDGFLTSKDRFVERKEAGEIAFKAGQIKELTGHLYSEDIY